MKFPSFVRSRKTVAVMSLSLSIIGFVGGGAVEVDGVYCYRRGPDGRLASLRAFWEPEQIRSVE